jgi:MoxR-like ATPase
VTVPGSPDDAARALAGQGYLADGALATAVYLAGALEQPLLLEGEAGVGKTEVARALAGATGARLIRLQCHEGIDVHHAVYDWDYARQLLAIRTAEAGAAPPGEVYGARPQPASRGGEPLELYGARPQPASRGGEPLELYGREFLLRRPLLEALEHDGPVVLLIDEIDRADDEFEAFLLELLSDFAITIPELGTVTAARRPLVVLTSNRTRELHDALKRRCLYHWIDYPDPEREAEIVRTRAPGVPEAVAARVCGAVARLRAQELYKLPGVGETITWARALLALDGSASLEATLGAALKVREDIDRVRELEVLRGA